MPQEKKRTTGRVISSILPTEKQVLPEAMTTHDDLHNMAEGMRAWVASFRQENPPEFTDNPDHLLPDQLNSA